MLEVYLQIHLQKYQIQQNQNIMCKSLFLKTLVMIQYIESLMMSKESFGLNNYLKIVLIFGIETVDHFWDFYGFPD